MANRQELSHFMLDFAMKTSKKVIHKDTSTATLEVKHLVSDYNLFSLTKVFCM